MVRTFLRNDLFVTAATARCLGKKVRTATLLQYSFSASRVMALKDFHEPQLLSFYSVALDQLFLT